MLDSAVTLFPPAKDNPVVSPRIYVVFPIDQTLHLTAVSFERSWRFVAAPYEEVAKSSARNVDAA